MLHSSERDYNRSDWRQFAYLQLPQQICDILFWNIFAWDDF